MSTKYTGGFITKSPVAPTSSAASGIWTLDQQQQAQKAGTWPSPPIFIEDLFSTYLNKPTTSNTAYSINNGIDLSGNGGMVWFKARDAAQNNYVYDTARGSSSGSNNVLVTNSTNAQQTANYDYLTFGSSGFTVNYATGGGQLTNNGINYVSWTFREAPKFFDIVTYTGNATAGRTIAHNLGAVPGCIIVKQTGGGGSGGVNNWFVYHRSLGATQAITLESTGAAFTSSSPWNNTTPTSTVFTVGGTSDCNDSGGTYVAYLFAHDAGGFPVSGGGSTNGISCGSFTTDGSGYIPTVNLGYEPQWILAKPSSGTGNWFIMDNMRSWYNQQADQGNALFPNTSGAEAVGYNAMIPTATGFTGPAVNFGAGITYIYIAIRRGPMKTPTVGTQVFSPQVQTPTAGANNNMAANSGFPIDWLPTKQNTGVTDWYQTSRLTNNYMSPNTTAAEASYTYGFDRMAGVGGGSSGWNTNSTVSYAFRRAPGFFDEVCATASAFELTATHNLGVIPELIIAKNRSTTSDWYVWASLLSTTQTRLKLNEANASANTGYPINSVTSTSFYAATANTSTATQVFYLFATCAGVSKVGSYTGTGAAQTINCGFTAGSRFVLIKRTDSTGDWYVWDSARGIIPANDPYLLINSTAAEVTGTDYIDTTNVGFDITSTAPAAINANGGTFIFLAIA